MNEAEYVVQSTVKNSELVKKRRAEIVAAAVKIFSEKGYDATTTKEIADSARMNVGTMFQYVKTKQDILYLVCCHIHSLIEEALYSVETNNVDLRDLMESFVKAIHRIFDNVSDYVVLVYQETASLEKQARDSFLRREKKLCHYLEQQMMKGIEEGVFHVEPQSVPLIAEDLLVQGQMWAFRRWSLMKNYSLESYISTRIAMLKTILGY